MASVSDNRAIQQLLVEASAEVIEESTEELDEASVDVRFDVLSFDCAVCVITGTSLDSLFGIVSSSACSIWHWKVSSNYLGFTCIQNASVSNCTTVSHSYTDCLIWWKLMLLLQSNMKTLDLKMFVFKTVLQQIMSSWLC